jgi:hypothetical protein
MSDANNTASYIVTILIAITSSGGLQYFLTRRQRKEQERKDDIQEKKDRDEVEQRAVDRRELLAEAQATAQRAALESAATRYKELEDDYKACRGGLVNLSQATGLLVGIVERIMNRLRPNGDDTTYVAEIGLDEVGEARRAINEVRRFLR